MSKTFGIVLLGGLLGSVLLSIGLILWVWTRSANSPQDIVNTTPVPTTKAAIQSPEKLGYTLVDARQEAGLALDLDGGKHPEVIETTAEIIRSPGP